MSYAYAYAPFSGTIVARPGGYCYGGSHPTICINYPFDITVGAGAAITVKLSSNIKSIKTTYYGSGVCYRDSEIPPPWDAKVKVELYVNLNGQDLIGSVCYAHVNSPIPNGTYNTNSKVIGYVPSNCSCQCNSGGNCICGGHSGNSNERGYCASPTGLCTEKCPCYCCYGGTHVHMEGSSTYNSGLNCYQGVSMGTWMYQWVMPI